MGRIVVLIMLVLGGLQAFALDLHIPGDSPVRQGYYLSLLRQALSDEGVEVRWRSLPAMSNERLQNMLENGDIEVYWFLRSAERDRRFLRVDVPLTDGMIGRRILMVRHEDREMFRNVTTLGGLRASGKVAALGKGWLDSQIWERNGLAWREMPTPVEQIYRLVAAGARKLDYFPRGVTEVAAESGIDAGLEPEPYLLLVYPQDFYFYVSTRNPVLFALLKNALKRAQERGLRAALFQREFGTDLDRLMLSRRREILLALPGE